MSDAISRGVDLKGNIMLRGLITDGNAVTGVEGDDLKENAPFRKTSSLVIDLRE